MSWCPDPRCGAPIADEHWTVEDMAYEQEPWNAERTEAWMWRATCPGCHRRISAWHGPSDALGVTPDVGEWCCPLCGGGVRLIAENRGPVAAALRCLEGCGALISMRRDPLSPEPHLESLEADTVRG